MPLLVLGVVGGLLLLALGAEYLVRGSTALAMRFGLTPLVIGLTVVAFGTSSPELVVSLQSSLSGNGAIALGNVIGSNISNIALILGVSALVRPLRVQVQIIRREIPLMILASVLLSLMLLGGQVNRLEGLLLFIAGIAYFVFAYIAARRNKSRIAESEFEAALPKTTGRGWVSLLLILLGLSMLAIGAKLLVHSAVAIAEAFGVSQIIIGLTVVAVGTSLPELATSVVAARKDEGDIVIGNVIGSNVLNVLFVLGLAALINPLHVEGLSVIDVIVMLGSAALVLPLMRRGFQLTRWEGTLLLAGYIGYISSVVLNN